MKKLIQLSILLFLLSACSQTVDKTTGAVAKKANAGDTTRYYCKAINDTFSVFVSLPNEYDKNKNAHYPVVYVVDANLYFPVLKSIQKEYSKVGLLRPAILVGIGYKDFETMDSLRDRDFTYPKAKPEYEMSASGNGQKFLSFMNNQVVPDIDKTYRVNKSKRILAGHSLGGFFTLFALQQNLLNKNPVFSGYIAASPSTNYNDNFVLNELEKLKVYRQARIKTFVTFGGLEYEEEEDSTMLPPHKVFLSLEQSLKNKVTYKHEFYSDLAHMDTPLPSFIKGLQWTLGVEE